MICLQAGTYAITETLSFVPQASDGDNAIAIIRHPRASGSVVITRAQNAGNIRLMFIDYGTTAGDSNGRVLVQGINFEDGRHPNEGAPYHGNGAGLYIRVNDAKVYVIGNVFRNNRNADGDTQERRGGGLYVLANGAGEVNVLNNLFVDNRTTYYGGGAYLETRNGTVNLVNNTFVNNVARDANTPNGGGANISISQDASARANIYNNLFWNNDSPAGADLYVFRGTGAGVASTVNLYNNLFRQTGTNLDNPTSGNFAISNYAQNQQNYNRGDNVLNDNNPFVPTSQCQYAVGPNSPALNAGKTDAPMVNLLTFDVMSNPRIVGTKIDIGAYEL